MTSLGRGPYGPEGMVVRFYKADCLKLLHTKYKCSKTHGLREESFCVFSHCTYMGANDTQGGTIFDPGT